MNAAKLRLKVVGQNGREVFFKIKSSTPLKKLIDAYCKEMDIPERACRFLFDGQRINPDHTAAYFDMGDEDIIDVFDGSKKVAAAIHTFSRQTATRSRKPVATCCTSCSTTFLNSSAHQSCS